MRVFDNVQPADVDRRELQLTILACSAIGVLAIGTAVLMYPVVFSREVPVNRSMRIAFLGFCVLCALLAAYLWDCQRTIRHLRSEMAEERKRVVQTQRLASVELLKTMPDLNSFQDRLAMEFRRTVATTQKLSILVMVVKFPLEGAMVMDRSVLLGDAAKVISRKLREQDSIYMLGPACFGAVLPGMEAAVAKRVSERVAEGLADAAGASHRFSCTINVANYPEDASSAHELEESVLGLIPEECPIRKPVEAVAE